MKPYWECSIRVWIYSNNSNILSVSKTAGKQFSFLCTSNEEASSDPAERAERWLNQCISDMLILYSPAGYSPFYSELEQNLQKPLKANFIQNTERTVRTNVLKYILGAWACLLCFPLPFLPTAPEVASHQVVPGLLSYELWMWGGRLFRLMNTMSHCSEAWLARSRKIAKQYLSPLIIAGFEYHE